MVNNNKLKTPILGIINSDNINDIYLLDNWINKMDKIIICGNLMSPLLNKRNENYYQNIDFSFLDKANKLLATNKIIIPINIDKNDNKQTNLEEIKDINSSTINLILDEVNKHESIVWYGTKIFNNNKITPGLQQVLISIAQTKKDKYFCDEQSTHIVFTNNKFNNSYQINQEYIKQFLLNLELSDDNYTKMNHKTRRDIDTEILDVELNKNTSIIKVPKKYIRLTKNEARRKRKKDERANLKNKNNNIVEIYNLTKNYVSGGDKITRVLNNLNLKIKKGEFIVLFGKSGSGKSTLLNIISGLDRPTRGDIIVLDHNLPYLSSPQLTKFRRKNLSFIFQQYHLLNNISGYENVETGLFLKNRKNQKKNKSEDHKIIENLFREFELLDVMNKFPSQMSGGQQQRISIMRALSKDAEIIFADEPTGALDKKTSTIVLELLKKINRTLNKTIIMVSHDPDVAKYATRVITLEKGIILNDKLVDNEL